MSRGLGWVLLILARIIAERSEEGAFRRTIRSDANRSQDNWTKLKTEWKKLLAFIDPARSDRRATLERSRAGFLLVVYGRWARRSAIFGDVYMLSGSTKWIRVVTRSLRSATPVGSARNKTLGLRFIISEASLRACSPCELRFPERRGPNHRRNAKPLGRSRRSDASSSRKAVRFNIDHTRISSRPCRPAASFCAPGDYHAAAISIPIERADTNPSGLIGQSRASPCFSSRIGNSRGDARSEDWPAARRLFAPSRVPVSDSPNRGGGGGALRDPNADIN